MNPTFLRTTHVDIEDIKTAESANVSQTITKSDTDGNFSSTRKFPGVPFDSESSKENQSKVPSPSTYQDMKTFKNKRTGMV